MGHNDEACCCGCQAPSHKTSACIVYVIPFMIRLQHGSMYVINFVIRLYACFHSCRTLCWKVSSMVLCVSWPASQGTSKACLCVSHSLSCFLSMSRPLSQDLSICLCVSYPLLLCLRMLLCMTYHSSKGLSLCHKVYARLFVYHSHCHKAQVSMFVGASYPFS